MGTQDALIESHLETVLAEGMKTGQATWMGFAAVCCYPWNEDSIPHVHDTMKQLFEKLDSQQAVNFVHDDLLTPSLLRIPSKEEYLARPARLFFDLEMSARLGLTNELNVTRWLFEELESRQDADGWVRFPATDERNWYFPLETKSAEDFHIEWTFRAAHIFKLLEYDF
jgi:hypothetical protein